MKRLHELADCENCPLFNPTQFVPSQGPDQADIVIVGEAPGYQEVKQQIPFTGESGKLLDRILEHHGIKREECFVTNTVLCRPEGNANPPAQATRACSNRLREEIRHRNPKRILALGNFAARSILQSDQKITSLRAGPPKRGDAYPGADIVSTFHPAACLYNPGSFPDLVRDIGKLAGTETYVAWEEPSFDILDTEEEAQHFLANLLDKTDELEVALDIEIGVDKDLEFEHADQYKLLAVGLAISSTHASVLGEEALKSPRVTSLLGTLVERKRIICHNGKFDLQGLLKFGNGVLYADTMLASYAMDERRGVHGLEYESVEKLGSPTWKHVIGRYLGGTKNFSAIPRPVLYRYNAFDVVNTYRLWKWFEKHLDPDLRRLHDHQVEVSNVMQYVERNGVAVDTDYLETLEDYYTERIESLRSSLRSMVGEPGYNPNSWQQVKRVLASEFRRRPRDTRKETIEKLMESAARAGDHTLYQFCRDHLEFKKESKSYGTYVKGTRIRLIGGRVYPTYLLHGTTNGRSSCRNPNLQNVTRGDRLRKLFIPGSDSTVFMQADYRQAELRAICALARDDYLHDVFHDDNRNIHEEVGKAYYGSDWTRDNKEEYIRAKAIVFGLSYGREAYSIAAEFGISEIEAQAQIDAFFNLIPQAAKWRESVMETVLNLEDLVSPYGQHRRFPLITSQSRKDILKEALSFLPQNIVAHTTFASAVEMCRRDPRFRNMLRITVHDSWILECEESETEEVGRFVAQTMEDTARERFTDYVPFPVDIGIAKSWGDID